MKKKLTVFLACAALLTAGSGTMWGQAYSNGYVTSEGVGLRRGDANTTPNDNDYGYVGTPGNVNNEFGAGESSIVRNGGVIWPAAHGMSSSNNPSTLLLGSTLSQNVVIRSYNAGGRIYGSLDIEAYTKNRARLIATGYVGKGGSDIGTLNGIMDFKDTGAGYTVTSAHNLSYNATTGPLGENAAGTQVRVLFFHHAAGLGIPVDVGSLGPQDWNGYTAVAGVNDAGTWYGNGYDWWDVFTFDITGTYDTLYTSTRAADKLTDDGIALEQLNGAQFENSSSAVLTPKKSGDATYPLDDYIRPTTVNVDGLNNTFDNIILNDNRWYYETYLNTSIRATTPTYSRNWSCGHGSSAPDGGLRIEDFFAVTPTWSAPTVLVGQTFLDAAVVLMDGAQVCVKGNVKDATPNIATLASADGSYMATNALLGFPVTDRVTLRTKGNFQMNMYHEKDSVTSIANNVDGIQYTAADFQTRTIDQQIYLYSSPTGKFHAYNAPLLREYKSSSYPAMANSTQILTEIEAPAPGDSASIFGVYGDYQYVDKMAEIHTDTVPSTFDGNGKGAIEVGNKTAGKSHFHIYSGGTLKNYEDCNINQNFAMEFGKNHGGTPTFNLFGDSTLYVLNYGNDNDLDPNAGCDADLLFYAGAVDTIGKAFTDGTVKNGAMHIQALSDISLMEDATISATKGNNLYLLSDGGNVTTQTMTVTSDYVNAIGKGDFTIWAEDRNGAFSDCANGVGNRNSRRGNVYLNDDINVTRSATSAAGTETNVIAANNVRSASVVFASTNQNNDSVNVISRKGDVYLGYSTQTQVYANDIAQSNGYNYDDNVFDYTISDPANAGVLNIKAGFDDANFDNVRGMNGGNVYFTSIKTDMIATGEYPTNIMIPYSNEYICGVADSLHSRNGQMQHYEHSGIIGGVGRCGVDGAWGEYAGALSTPASNAAATNLALDYKGNKGTLTVDAGQRGNIIMNTGSKLDFQADNGNAIFRTREGDIDMRSKTDATGMAGNLMFLASIDNLSALKNIFICGCDEERNNVYLQDFQFTATGGSVLFGADNNIKLNYGGLQNQGTHMDPFLSTNYNAADPSEKIGSGYNGTTCGSNYHCDMTPSENLARDLLADFSSADSGGFAAVASDRIDVYKKLIYNGGTGTGIMSVPTSDGRLHGENVTGYGLYMLTQGNKSNYNHNIFLSHPTCPTGDCGQNNCSDAFLHNTIRMTFHDEARFYAENQKVYIASPVIESFGHLELNTRDNAGSNGFITMKMDSLICHDSLIFNGNKYKFTTWSGLPGDKPIIKLGYNRNKPPFTEYKYKDEICAPCHKHIKGSKDYPLDTISVKFGDDATLERQNVTVLDHTILTFLTDSFDHQLQSGVRNAKIYVDTLKVRNQVELWADGAHTRDAHFELISEEQMFSKDYAGMYTRHLHMEPIGPDCARNTSELWLSDDRALDVITTSTFGGFGVINADVHVENEGFLAPGFASLGLRGNCYEQHAGTLTMDDLRLDGGAIINVTVGDATPGPDGYLDMVNVLGNITTYGNVYIHIKLRPCQHLPNMCGAINPVLKYNTATPGSLNNVFLVVDMPKKDSKEYTDYKDDWDALAKMTLNMTSEGEIYICESSEAMVEKSREINMPSVAGVTTNPPAGIHYVKTGGNFNFTASYTTDKPYVVKTNRYFDGVQEVLEGKKNANGEYEYTIGHVTTEPIEIYIGPEFVANASIEGNAVWSHNNTIYIKVDRADIASIYSVAGQLVKRVELSEGDTSIPAERGVYIITLKDGSVHKVIVK